MVAAAFAGAGILTIALGAALAFGALTLLCMGGHWITIAYTLATQGG